MTTAREIQDFEAFIRQEFDNYEDFKMPTHKIVCPVCHGKGSHVDPAIDGHGLSRDDPDLDEDFWEDYFSGVYDMRCTECGGQNVVDEVDEDRLTSEIMEEWQTWQREMADLAAMYEAERRMGA